MEGNIYLTVVWILVATFVCTKILPSVWRMYRDRWTLMKMFPALDNNHWLFGDLLDFPGMNEDGLIYNNNYVAKYPRYYLLSFGAYRTQVQLNHPETIKQLTRTPEPKQLRDGGGYNVLYPWIGDGLLLSSGKKWARNRRLLTHGFHFDVLKPYVNIYNDCVERMMDRFAEESCVTGNSFEICNAVGKCTFDIILQCAFSTDQDIQRKEENAYLTTVNALSIEAVQRSFNPLLYPEFLFYLTQGGRQFRKNCAYTHGFANTVIKKRREELQHSDTVEDIVTKGRYIDFLDILLMAKDEDGNGLSARDILDEVQTFMFAGHDTTASGVSWVLYNLAKHPEIQANARAEVDSLLDERETDRLLWKDMTQFPYVTRCIKESLRLHSAVPFIGRELTSPLQMDDKVIPAGTYVDINIWNLHHNPTVWIDPMTYDPDRFLPEKMAKMDSHAFMPFSAGPRNCIGQNFAMNEIKTTAVRILRRFELSVDVTKPVKMKPDLVLRAESGIHLYFKERK